MSVEVSIYVQKVKNFVLSNKGANDFFLNGIDIGVFIKEVQIIAEKNFNESGVPVLTPEQFEEIKNKFENSEPKEDLSEIFLNFKDFGEINPN